MTIKTKFIGAGMALSLVSSANAAVLSVGTTFGIDMGPTVSDNATTIMNSIQPGVASETIPAGGLLDTSGVVVDGVSVTALGTGFTFSNNDAATNAELAGQPAIFNDSNLTDWFGTNGTGRIVISGLDDSLTYDVLIGHGFIVNGTVTDTTYGALGAANTGISATNQHDSTTGGAFVNLVGLSSSGGVLELTVSAGGSSAGAVSALTVTATPEPSSTALLGFGGLALLLRRRK